MGAVRACPAGTGGGERGAGAVATGAGGVQAASSSTASRGVRVVIESPAALQGLLRVSFSLAAPTRNRRKALSYLSRSLGEVDKSATRLIVADFRVRARPARRT